MAGIKSEVVDGMPDNDLAFIVRELIAVDFIPFLVRWHGELFECSGVTEPGNERIYNRVDTEIDRNKYYEDFMEFSHRVIEVMVDLQVKLKEIKVGHANRQNRKGKD